MERRVQLHLGELSIPDVDDLRYFRHTPTPVPDDTDVMFIEMMFPVLIRTSVCPSAYLMLTEDLVG